jgi:phosphatidylcholine synthase
MTRPASALRLAACWAVHFYTATGAVMAFAALHAVFAGNVQAAFFWLYAAVAVDASDGVLARAARVKEHLPHFDGAKLDDIVDYLTFVMVPIVLLVETGLLAGGLGIVAACAAVLASAYRFCHADAKTADHYFTGFPSYWNVVALYFYVYRPSATACAIMTLGLGLLWGVAVALILIRLPARSLALATVSLVFPAYYALLSFYAQWRGR